MLGHFMNIYLNVSAVNPNSINKAFVFSILFSFLLKIVGNDVVMVCISSSV